MASKHTDKSITVEIYHGPRWLSTEKFARPAPAEKVVAALQQGRPGRPGKNGDLTAGDSDVVRTRGELEPGVSYKYTIPLPGDRVKTWPVVTEKQREVVSPVVRVSTGEVLGTAVRLMSSEKRPGKGVIFVPRPPMERNGKIELSDVHAFGEQLDFIASNPNLGAVLAYGKDGESCVLAHYCDVRISRPVSLLTHKLPPAAGSAAAAKDSQLVILDGWIATVRPTLQAAVAEYAEDVPDSCGGAMLLNGQLAGVHKGGANQPSPPGALDFVPVDSRIVSSNSSVSSYPLDDSSISRTMCAIMSEPPHSLEMDPCNVWSAGSHTGEPSAPSRASKDQQPVQPTVHNAGAAPEEQRLAAFTTSAALLSMLAYSGQLVDPTGHRSSVITGWSKRLRSNSKRS